MGTFLGHIFPGFFFIIFSLWSTFNVAKKRILDSKKRLEYKSTATYACFCYDHFQSIPLESVIKFLCCTCGIVLELVLWFKGGFGIPVLAANLQHASMYAAFAVSGVAETCLHYKRGINGIEYVMGAFAFGVEGFLFQYHLLAKSNRESKLHLFLILTAYASSAAYLLELRFRKNQLVAFFRCQAILLNGLWFWCVAFMLFPPSPSLPRWKDDSKLTMLAACLFVWMALIAIGIVTLVNYLTYIAYSRYWTLNYTVITNSDCEDDS